jgi:hypothetical protein
MSCAQVNITGGGNIIPSATASIPGAFKSTDPGYTANVSAKEVVKAEMRIDALTFGTGLQRLPEELYRSGPSSG